MNQNIRKSGFTLVELLVVITIIVVLAAAGFLGASSFIDRSRRVQALAQFKDLEAGIRMFEVDYIKPPVPLALRDTGLDMIYGNPGGAYPNNILVAALAGNNQEISFQNQTFSGKDLNPRGEVYIVFPLSSQNRNGVGADGKLYDPWGGELIIAVNGFKSTNPDDVLVPFNNGQNDSRLHTEGFAVYTETLPRDQPYVFWSYGKDKKKGKNGPSPTAVVPYTASDDVISWQ